VESLAGYFEMSPRPPDPKKPTQRYYLFAGMGGSAGRRKHRRILAWSIVAGVFVSVAVAALIFLLNRGGK
jgi:hypothetical protein